MSRTAEEIVDGLFQQVMELAARGTKRNNVGPVELPVEDRHLVQEITNSLAQRCEEEIDGCIAELYVDGQRRIAGVLHFI